LEEYDVIVVGAGLGGCSAAIFLAERGAKVLLLDRQKFPRDKICGDALSGKSMKVLRELGLKSRIPKLRHGAIRGTLLSSPNGEILDLGFADGKGKGREIGYVVRRIDFDNLIFQKAKKKAAKTIENFTVTHVLQEDGRAIGIEGTKNGKQYEYRAKMIIGADGAHSSIVRALGIEKHPPKHMCTAFRAYYDNVEGLTDRIEIHFIKGVIPGYLWIFPLDGKNANVGIGMVDSELRKRKVDLRKLMEEALKKHPMFRERFRKAKLVTPITAWALPFGSKHQQIHGDGFLLVGDAAALIDPFSGEGMGNALLSGQIAAEVAAKALKKNRFDGEFLGEYAERVWDELDAELQTSYTMQRLGRINPLLNMIIHKAATKPEVKDAIVGMLSNEEAKQDLVTIPGLIKLLIFK
jgi:geranylgeranyl reductase family protein